MSGPRIGSLFSGYGGRVGPVNVAVKCENTSEAARWWNTERPLTHLLDATERGLAVKATQVVVHA